ncbi:MAG: HD-GYP domain-containing protein [Lachnospiraceae bacterium]|nr:HD-GYP domain-containing protein [Lachnospiraceae bacterium]
MIVLFVGQYFGIYYTFDETNHYMRSWGYMISYLFPLLITIMHVTIVIEYNHIFSRRIRKSLLAFMIVPYIATGVQIFAYGLSLTNITMVGMAILLYVYAHLDIDDAVDHANKIEIEMLKDEQKKIHRLFEQTAEALANAIDAKDKYTHGHSTRVAEYSERIARIAGKTEKECEEVYFAGLLHDVGKIGISDAIINKQGKLTDEEYNAIKQHPVIGKQILRSIEQTPYLSIGANYHHERYDGRGYPEGLKGEDIPEIARIIAVADAYDAMTSKRSYRYPIPQQHVREEIVKGIGIQFDPKFAKIMLSLIDMDVDYQMKESESVEEFQGKRELHFEEYGSGYSNGVLINEHMTEIFFRSRADSDADPESAIPTLLLFDALDERVHINDPKKDDVCYFEYGKIRLDGRTVCLGARKMQTKTYNSDNLAPIMKDDDHGRDYKIYAVRIKDHMLVKVVTKTVTRETIIALPDSTRFVDIAVTGEKCTISRFDTNKSDNVIPEGYIPRIAEEISFIKDMPVGDVPNVQIDGWCKDNSQGIEITDGMKISFHTKSLPTARLVWHCPYVRIFASEDGKVNGEGYKDFILVRLDGENWESDVKAENKIFVNQTNDFKGWEYWKEKNKEGMDCVVELHYKSNKVTVSSENLGVIIKSETIINDKSEKLYAALTGDQVALTDIRITR